MYTKNCFRNRRKIVDIENIRLKLIKNIRLIKEKQHVDNDKDNGPKITKEVLYTTQEGHIFNQIKLYLSLV